MIWNPWKHVRLAGGVVVLVAFFVHNFPLTLLGLGLQYMGVIGAIDLLERKFDALTEVNKNDSTRPE